LIRVAARGLKGDGVLARKNIAAGTFIAEYVGRKLRSGNHHGMNYVMKIGNVHVDAEGNNSYAGKINHGCNPNCLVEQWFVDGKLRAKIVTVKDVGRRDELTIDYQWYGNVKCECGDRNCRGTI
jgi:histone-lysine N-methyltransferase SETD2